jgi:hypothetical protein|tara:strand:+ start:682 stop:858 length:177 start_codon:yes stop_codon:yes gene_type:complete
MTKDSSTLLFSKIKETAHNIKEWDKKWARKIQDKFNLTDYQMLCLSFAKGVIIGAIIL